MSSRAKGNRRTPARARTRSLALIGLIALAATVVVAGAWALRPAPSTAGLPAPTAGGNVAPVARVPAAATKSSGSAQKTPVTAEDGAVRLAAADYEDGKARFYTYQAGDKTIPFFVLKGSDGVLRVAYDACDVCFAAKRGYRQEGDVMVCNNCGNRFPSVRINVETGGCNPAPLEAEVQGDSLVIQASAIEAGARYF